MTGNEFADALKELGATNIRLIAEFFDGYGGLGIAAQCRFDGRLVRYAAMIAPGAPHESAFPALLDAIKEKAAEQAA